MLRDYFGPSTATLEEPPEAPFQATAIADGEPAPPPSLRAALGEPARLPEALMRVKERVHRRLIDELDQDRLSKLSPQEARVQVREAALVLLNEEQERGLAEHRQRVLDEILDDVLGLGPLEPLLRDDTVTEVMVNGPSQVFVERGGRLFESGYAFRDEEHLMRVIERIVSPLGRHVDEASPMVDARLPDGSRVNVVVPPAAPRGPKITLRKFARRRLRTEDMLELGTLSPQAIEFLRAAVRARLNILVSGGTGAGKTTLLNVLSSFIGENERIVTIEDPMELQLQQRHVVALEARPPGIEGSRQITQRDLVRNSLRMRPDRIIVGEVRGGEAFDMLQAMNTGHEGSISTVHANTPRDALSRVENMVMMAGFDLPDRAIREQVSAAIHLLVQISRMRDGSRRVTHITEVSGMEGQTITLQDLFLFHPGGFDENGRLGGLLEPTGLRPHCIERFERADIVLPPELLRSERW